jgi:hypothetical protein
MQSRSPQVLALVASGSSVLGIGAVLAALVNFGPHAQHMAVHILIMNVGAPVLAAIRLARWKIAVRGVALLWLATIAQIAVLWVWQLPVVQSIGAHFPGATSAGPQRMPRTNSTISISRVS